MFFQLDYLSLKDRHRIITPTNTLDNPVVNDKAAAAPEANVRANVPKPAVALL